MSKARVRWFYALLSLLVKFWRVDLDLFVHNDKHKLSETSIICFLLLVVYFSVWHLPWILCRDVFIVIEFKILHNLASACLSSLITSFAFFAVSVVIIPYYQYILSRLSDFAHVVSMSRPSSSIWKTHLIQTCRWLLLCLSLAKLRPSRSGQSLT